MGTTLYTRYSAHAVYKAIVITMEESGRTARISQSMSSTMYIFTVALLYVNFSMGVYICNEYSRSDQLM